MTRKRFVKKLMALGFSRNVAQAMADQRPSSVPYDRWLLCCTVVISCGWLAKALRMVAMAVTDAFEALLSFGSPSKEALPDE